MRSLANLRIRFIRHLPNQSKGLANWSCVNQRIIPISTKAPSSGGGWVEGWGTGRGSFIWVSSALFFFIWLWFRWGMGGGWGVSFKDDAMCTQLTVARETAWGHASSYRGDWQQQQQQQQHTKIIREIEKTYVRNKWWTKKRENKKIKKQTKRGNEKQLHPPPCPPCGGKGVTWQVA